MKPDMKHLPNMNVELYARAGDVVNNYPLM